MQPPTPEATPLPDQNTILLIEDNHATSELVQDILDQEGYAVICAGSGEAGLAAMEQQPADLVLLDVMLPGMDGFEVCRRLKARWGRAGEGHFLPVVMLTARGATNDVVAGLEAGADEYLRKPFEVDELLLRVRAMFRIVHNERALARRNRELEASYAQERQTRRRLEALEAVTAVGLSDLPLDAMLAGLIEKMARITSADTGAIFLDEPDVKHLQTHAVFGDAARVNPADADLTDFLRRLSRHGQTMQALLNDADSDGHSERAVLGVLLTVRGRRLGAAVLGRTGALPFSQEEMRLFETMANRAALAIENAALHARAERDLEMKTLLMRELQHRVRNNLQAISGILSFQLSTETTAEAAIKGALRRIKSISATQDFLFKREGGPIPLHPLLETVAHQLATLWALPDQSVQVTSNRPGIDLAMEHAQIVGLVVHELIANAFQHGLRDRPGIIRLNITAQPSGVEIAVIDPGPGFPPHFDLASSPLAGLKLVQILLQREFRVGLQLESAAGQTRVAFTIPLEYFPAMDPRSSRAAVLHAQVGNPEPRG